MLRHGVISAMCVLACSAAPRAQGVEVVKDINRTVKAFHSDPQGWNGRFVAMGGWLYTLAREESVGRELFRFNATPGSGRLVKDTVPGYADGEIAGLIAVGARLFFTAKSPVGRELWASDGTTAGTALVKDILPGSLSSMDWHGLSMDGMGGKLYFAANDGVHGLELWVSDGTAGGTRMVIDLNPGTGSSGPTMITAMRDRIYFFATGGTNRRALWTSDGTPQGTRVIATTTGAAYHNLSQNPNRGFLVSDDRFFFHAPDSTNGTEPWVSDGTPEGTVKLRDIRPGGSGCNPRNGVAFGGRFYFDADDGSTGRELWSTDGTPAGTRQVRDFLQGPYSSNPGFFRILGDRFIFSIENATFRGELVISDGTTAGTRAYHKGLKVKEAAVCSGRVYYRADSGTPGDEMWSTDGTTAGTRKEFEFLFPQTMPFSVSSTASLTPFGGRLFFRAYDPMHGLEVMSFGGSPAALSPHCDINGPMYTAGSKPELLTPAWSRTFFLADDGVHGRELWVTDGTAAGTRLTRDLHPGTSGNPATALCAFQDRVVFAADRGGAGREPWISDGTVAGTRMLADLNPGAAASDPQWFLSDGERLYFEATGPGGKGLYASDGTPAGTRLLHGSLDRPGAVTRVGGRVLLTARHPQYGYELWETDGSPSGTRLVKDINPGTGDGVYGLGWTLGGRVYFFGRGPQAGLWASDGTTAGTVRVKPSLMGVHWDLRERSACLGDRMVFLARDPSLVERVWVTDGTETGTQVLTMPIAVNLRAPTWFLGAGTKAFLGCNAGSTLIVTDGSQAGTAWVSNQPAVGYNPLRGGEGRAVFGGPRSGASPGDVLWESDGTTAGTRVLPGNMPGMKSYTIKGLVAQGRLLILIAETDRYGVELYRLERTGWSRPVGYATGAPGLEAGDPRLGFNLRLDVTDISPALGGMVLFGAPGGGLAWGAGHLYFDPAALYMGLAVAPGAGGVGSLSLPVPNDPALRGAEMTAQGFVGTVPGMPLGFHFTNGVRLYFGR